MPDYDGRPDPDPDAGDVLLWVPRVLLFPAWWASEAVIRKPLGSLVTHAELNHWPTIILDVFTFGEDRKVGIFPTFLIDFGFRASGGLYFFWSDLGVEGHDLTVRAATGGEDWVKLRLTDRIAFSRERGNADVEVAWSRRPDHLFYGLGASVERDDGGRYRLDQIDARASLRWRWWRESEVMVEAGVRQARFGAGGCCEGPSLADLVAASELALPPGFRQGFLAPFIGASLAVDTRHAHPASATGVRAVAISRAFLDAERPDDLAFVRYGAALTGTVDLTGTERVLGLTGEVSFADPLRSDPVPFTELVFLGGDQPMPGFRAGRLIDRSAASLTLEYRWPVWLFTDGFLAAGVGNVFGPHLSDFSPEDLRLSFGFGLRPLDRVDRSFYLFLGAGTETFRDGGEPTTVRFVVGTTDAQ